MLARAALQIAVAQAGHVEAVDEVDVLEAGRAADGDVAAAVDERAGRSLDDVAVGPPERNVVHELLVEVGLDAGAADVDRRSLGGDDVGLLGGGRGGAGDLGVHPDRLFGGDDDAGLLHLRRRVGRVEPDDVGPDREGREAVLALVAGDDGVFALGAGHDHGDAAERQPRLLIGHAPGHPPGRLLRPGRACAEEQCQSQGRCTNSNPGHLSSLSVRQGCQTVGGASHIALVVKEVEAIGSERVTGGIRGGGIDGDRDVRAGRPGASA